MKITPSSSIKEPGEQPDTAPTAGWPKMMGKGDKEGHIYKWAGSVDDSEMVRELALYCSTCRNVIQTFSRRKKPRNFVKLSPELPHPRPHLLQCCPYGKGQGS